MFDINGTHHVAFHGDRHDFVGNVMLEDVDVYVSNSLHPLKATLGHFPDERVERHVLAAVLTR
jgi:hypothetical protein